MSAILLPHVRRLSHFRSHARLALCAATLLASSTSAAFAAAPVAADEPNATKTLGEITVTAEKRTENVQKEPEAITTIDTEKLDVITSGGGDVQ